MLRKWNKEKNPCINNKGKTKQKDAKKIPIKELCKTQIVKKPTTKKIIKKDLSDTDDDDPTIKHILGKIMNTNFVIQKFFK